jgi:hypothetical protein
MPVVRSTQPDLPDNVRYDPCPQEIWPSLATHAGGAQFTFIASQ